MPRPKSKKQTRSRRRREAPSAKPDVRRAVLYARVSSRDQEKEGYSIPAQQRLLQKYAEDHGIEIAKEFIDVETAKRAGRKSFGEMLGRMDVGTALVEAGLSDDGKRPDCQGLLAQRVQPGAPAVSAR